jgi:hypothetical protein
MTLEEFLAFDTITENVGTIHDISQLAEKEYVLEKSLKVREQRQDTTHITTHITHCTSDIPHDASYTATSCPPLPLAFKLQLTVHTTPAPWSPKKGKRKKKNIYYKPSSPSTTKSTPFKIRFKLNPISSHCSPPSPHLP